MHGGGCYARFPSLPALKSDRTAARAVGARRGFRVAAALRAPRALCASLNTVSKRRLTSAHFPPPPNPLAPSQYTAARLAPSPPAATPRRQLLQRWGAWPGGWGRGGGASRSTQSYFASRTAASLTQNAIRTAVATGGSPAATMYATGVGQYTSQLAAYQPCALSGLGCYYGGYGGGYYGGGRRRGGGWGGWGGWDDGWR